VGFVISFLLIGLNWTIHHRMFGYVTAYNRRLLWLNLFFLFFIVLMPFSTGLYGEFRRTSPCSSSTKSADDFLCVEFFAVPE
jgi:uncharacterized membrane protein